MNIIQPNEEELTTKAWQRYGFRGVLVLSVLSVIISSVIALQVQASKAETKDLPVLSIDFPMTEAEPAVKHSDEGAGEQPGNLPVQVTPKDIPVSNDLKAVKLPDPVVVTADPVATTVNDKPDDKLKLEVKPIEVESIAMVADAEPGIMQSKLASSFSEKFGSAVKDMNKNGLEIVFLFDSTGSMGPQLREAKQKIDFLMAMIVQLVPRHRMGIGTYRDLDSGYIVKGMPLTTDMAKLKEFLNGIEDAGGGDVPEAVSDAVLWALDQNPWSRRAHKVIIIIGDAPAHKGEKFNATLKRIEEFAKKKRGQVNTIVTFEKDVVEKKALAQRVFNNFTLISNAGGGDTLTFSKEATLVKRMFLLTFGKKFEKDINAIYEEALKTLVMERPQSETDSTFADQLEEACLALHNENITTGDLLDAIKQIGKINTQAKTQGLEHLLQAEDFKRLYDLIDHDDDWISYHAVKVSLKLAEMPAKDHAVTIAAQLDKRQESSFRGFYITMLGELRQLAGVPALLRILKEPDKKLSRKPKALEALREISGESFGQSYQVWADWYSKASK